MAFTADQLRDVLQRHAPVVDMALEAFFPDPKAPISLDGLRPLAVGGRDIADVLITILEGGDLSGSLMAFLAARGIDIIQRDDASLHPDAVPPPPGTAIPEPVPNDFPLDAVGPFALRASAFRCRIEVSGITEGSGAFVSKRLVLTAAHVIDRVIEADEAARAQGERHPVLPQITVRASDGRRFPARCVWYSPVHDDERAGNDPPANEATAHKDTALLQVGLPLGLSYGYCELPAQPVDWTGARLMTLVHYPDGNVKGLTRGRVLRNSPQDLRLRHDVNTEGGSSGGLAFDRDLDFIGIHQGRFDDARRLVPHGVFSDAPGFAEAIARDAPRRYLWSLGDDIEGQLVIGRQQFFAGLAKMLEDPATRLRGIWIRRLDTDTTTGLSFSFDMLEAFLANRVRPTDVQTSHATFKIPTDLEEEDLNHRLAEDILGARAAGPRAGVRTGETSDIAAQRDRAVRLAEDLQKKAAGEGATYWIARLGSVGGRVLQALHAARGPQGLGPGPPGAELGVGQHDPCAFDRRRSVGARAVADERQPADREGDAESDRRQYPHDPARGRPRPAALTARDGTRPDVDGPQRRG